MYLRSPVIILEDMVQPSLQGHSIKSEAIWEKDGRLNQSLNIMQLENTVLGKIWISPPLKNVNSLRSSIPHFRGKIKVPHIKESQNTPRSLSLLNIDILTCKCTYMKSKRSPSNCCSSYSAPIKIPTNMCYALIKLSMESNRTNNYHVIYVLAC